MGIKDSKISPGPKIFFLVFGGPTITYRRGIDNGPLIFNVDPMERRVEPPASAETRKCPIYCSGKQPFKLVKVQEGDNVRWRLQFTIDSASTPFKLKLYVGTRLDYEHVHGFGIQPTSPTQDQFCVAEAILQPGVAIPFSMEHSPISLQPLETTAANNPDEVFTRLSASPIVVEMICDGTREGDISEGSQTRLYLFLTFNKSDLEHGAESREFIPAACVKQYIFSNGDLFEADDVFDLRGDEAPAASPHEPGSPDGPVEDVEVDDDATCVVCLTNERNTTIIPCRHMCVCAECAGLLQQNSGKCPMCRREIQKLLTLAS